MAPRHARFELCNLHLFSHYLQRKDPTDPRTRHALSEVGDETRHMRMSARLLTTCGAPVHEPPAYLRRLFTLTRPLFQDLTTFAMILAIEELTGHLQRLTLPDERVQPSLETERE
ncbi:diiron oxygenase [Streptomyces sp. NPDC101234]|uniref:diiron oxygenase n=1 Tax=Streptomyces sp. NPDC101234 TaxID=3366138 RepID=UPI003802499D